jgi:hypothetical protein
VRDAAVARSSGWALLDDASIRTLQACAFAASLDALINYVESCRFGFDPAIEGERTDTVYGRVVLR